nr:LPXTG cell wall anchor domain-containing protein [Fructilactobacillus sanfranciscensis]
MGHNGEVTSDQTIGHNGTVTTGSPLTSTSTDKAKSASVAETLPQTGTSSSNSFMALIGMLLLSLVSILGLGKLNKKRN